MKNCDNKKKKNWDKLISKIKHVIIPEYKTGELTEAIVDSVQVRISENEDYLIEIGQGKISGLNTFRMNQSELKRYQLSYNESNKVLVDNNDYPASTIGRTSKYIKDVQAFIMSKEGVIYIASHGTIHNPDNTTSIFTHASFLGGKPVEMAGLIKIDKGKIIYISDNSGHYQPDTMDMYRGIKKIQKLMPEALDKKCIISLYGKEDRPVTDLIEQMEKKFEGNITYYEKLREQKIKVIKKDKTGTFDLSNLQELDIKEKNPLGHSNFYVALRYNSPEAAKIIIKSEGFNSNEKDQDGNTALCSAIKRNKTEIVKLLLDHKNINVNEKDSYYTLLQVAIQDNNLKIVKLLLDHKNINVNEKNKFGVTSLHLAIQDNNLEIVKLLLDHKNINVNEKNNNSDTPLHFAIMRNKTEIVKLLLDHKNINVNEKDDIGYTPLHVAILCNKTEIVKLLLDHKNINVNEKNKIGDTPLHLASKDNKTEIVKLLLDHKNINVNEKNKIGDTPLHLASKDNKTEIVELLNEYKESQETSIDSQYQGISEVQYQEVLEVKFLGEEGI